MSRDARSVQRQLGARIHALRQARSLTQEQLAQQCGISQKYLSELERGAKAPSFDVLVELAHRGFRIRLAALVFGIDDDVATELRGVDDVLAGRSAAARTNVLRAIQLVLDAGSMKEPASLPTLAAEPRRPRR